jgi:hypothetical protein
VGAVELAVVDVVARAFALRQDAATALIDREDLIACAVRDEESRASVRVDRQNESGRERDDALEQIAVREADPGIVGEAPEWSNPAARRTRGAVPRESPRESGCSPG